MKAKHLLVLALAALPLAACNNNQPAASSNPSVESSTTSRASQESVPATSSTPATTSEPATTSAPAESASKEESKPGEESNPAEESHPAQESAASEQAQSEEESHPAEGSDPVVISEEDSGESEEITVKLVFSYLCDDGETPTEIAANGVILTMGQGTNKSVAPMYYDNGSDLRLYAGNTFSVEGIGISKIVFSLNDKAGSFSADKGSVESDQSALADTWTGEAADKVNFTVASGQRRIVEMTITCTGKLDIPDISFPEDSEPELEGDTLEELIVNFLAYRGVTVDYAPGINGISDELVFYYEYELEEYLYEGNNYSPYFYVEFTEDVNEKVFENLTAEGFSIPDETTEYGYECVNEVQGIEVDVANDEDEGYTCLYFYAYDDVY